MLHVALRLLIVLEIGPESHQERKGNQSSSVATVQLGSAWLGFTGFGRNMASKVERSGVPGNWLHVTRLDSWLSHDLTDFKPYKEHSFNLHIYWTQKQFIKPVNKFLNILGTLQ